MPATYTLISSNVLSSSAASVTFSSIPATYTDLVLRYSARKDDTGAASSIGVVFNSSGGTDYSYIRLSGTGSAAASGVVGSNNRIVLFLGTTSSGATSNTFASGELYIPSYTASQNKPSSSFTTSENNATEAYAVAIAGMWRSTSTINNIELTAIGANFVTGSSFYLYGISNA